MVAKSKEKQNNGRGESELPEISKCFPFFSTVSIFIAAIKKKKKTFSS